MAKPMIFDLEESPKPKKSKSTPKVEKQTKSTKAQNNLPSPADVAPVPEVIDPPIQGQVMQSLTKGLSGRVSLFARLFWGAILFLALAVLSNAFWGYALNLWAQKTPFSYLIMALLAFVIFCLCFIALREWVGFIRLGRVDKLRSMAERISLDKSREPHSKFVARLNKFYRGRRDLEWAQSTYAEQEQDVLDGFALRDFAEKTYFSPLDVAARKEIETAARQVATGTAIVPLAFADVIIALSANIRMIRRIAEIYGGRTGRLGSWRLLRSVAMHLVATGAVAVGDDMIGSIAGGSLVGKLSRRFGEGVINGALTVRVGIAAMELCRPMPFKALPKPGVTETLKQALKGFFAKS